MRNKTPIDFVESALKDAFKELDMSKDMIPHLVYLLNKYPDSSIAGATTDLKEALELQIVNEKNAGNLG